MIAELSRLQAEPAGPTRRVSIEVTDLGLACDSDELPAAARGLPGPSTPSGPPSAGSGSRSAEAPEVRARRRIGDRVWDRLNQIRAEIASERGWSDVQPLHPMDPGRVELACRLSESGAAGEAMARHVLAVAEAEARATGSVRYLSGSLFEARWWRDKLARRPADAGPPGSRAPAQAPTPAGARPHARVGAPARAQGLRAADMLDQQLAHVAELRARAAAPHPFDGGPADPACDLCGEGRAHPLHAGASAGEDPVTPC